MYEAKAQPTPSTYPPLFLLVKDGTAEFALLQHMVEYQQLHFPELRAPNFFAFKQNNSTKACRSYSRNVPFYRKQLAWNCIWEGKATANDDLDFDTWCHRV